jgi:hypothetical protein
MWKCRLDLNDTGEGAVVGSYGYRNKSFGFIKGGGGISWLAELLSNFEGLITMELLLGPIIIIIIIECSEKYTD